MASAKNIRKVLMVTNKVPRRWQDTNNTAIGDCTRRNPNAVLVDWYSYSAGHSDWFQNGTDTTMPAAIASTPAILLWRRLKNSRSS